MEWSEQLLIKDSNFSFNQAVNGGAIKIFLIDKFAIIENCHFYQNNAIEMYFV